MECAGRENLKAYERRLMVRKMKATYTVLFTTKTTTSLGRLDKLGHQDRIQFSRVEPVFLADPDAVWSIDWYQQAETSLHMMKTVTLMISTRLFGRANVP